jgi:DNA-binding NtrC family response regulator
MKRSKAVDLVITDQAMPGMSGVQLAAALRAEWPGTPVLVATGYAELPSSAGADLPRLNKPFLQDALARAITEVMGQAGLVIESCRSRKAVRAPISIRMRIIKENQAEGHGRSPLVLPKLGRDSKRFPKVHVPGAGPQ